MIKKLLSHPIIILIICLFVLGIAYSLIQNITSLYSKKNSLQKLETEKKSLQIEVDHLKENVIQSQESFYSESVVRNELYMQKPEETVILLPLEKTTLNDSSFYIQESDEEKNLQLSPFQQWLAIFL